MAQLAERAVRFGEKIVSRHQGNVVAAVAHATRLGQPLLPVWVWAPAQLQPTRWVAQRMGPESFTQTRSLSSILCRHAKAGCSMPPRSRNGGKVIQHHMCRQVQQFLCVLKQIVA